MPTTTRDTGAAARYVEAVRACIERGVAEYGGTAAINPGHRVPFHWPPHPISYNYHILPSDWRGSTTVEMHGEVFEVRLAKTRNRVFGRCEALWLESVGKSVSEMLAHLQNDAEPLFRRQFCIARSLGRKERFTGHLKDLSNEDLLALLYSPDRDVANDARTVLETRPHKPDLLPALLDILRDLRHPLRRSAQWCVLDLFEDLPSYCAGEADEAEAIEVMKALIRTAEDDFARTAFKAGVVLGGHLPSTHGGPALIECLQAPSKIGRRSAIHGLFHVVEWHPQFRDEVVTALCRVAEDDPDPLLRDYAAHMAHDIETDSADHIPEPVFPEENAS